LVVVLKLWSVPFSTQLRLIVQPGNRVLLLSVLVPLMQPTGTVVLVGVFVGVFVFVGVLVGVFVFVGVLVGVLVGGGVPVGVLVGVFVTVFVGVGVLGGWFWNGTFAQPGCRLGMFCELGAIGVQPGCTTSLT
jgi:hypothetical protein